MSTAGNVIAGKVALVTGAGQGIGRAIALRLARDGADIALVDINGAKLDAVAAEVVALGRKASVFIADVSKREQVVAAVEHAHQALGGFDIIVNNAGVAQIDSLLEVSPEQVEREVQHYQARVEAERASQAQADDETADAVRMGAPEIVPLA